MMAKKITRTIGLAEVKKINLDGDGSVEIGWVLKNSPIIKQGAVRESSESAVVLYTGATKSVVCTMPIEKFYELSEHE